MTEDNSDKPMMHLFMHIGKLLNDRLRSELGKAGIHFGQARVLTALMHHGQLAQRTIGEGLDIKPATVTNMVKRMEVSELIDRRRDPDDDRIIIVRLTLKGKEAAQFALTVVGRIEDEIRSNLSPEELETLASPLERVRNALGGTDPKI